VRIQPNEYRMMKAFFEDMALRRTAGSLGSELQAISYEPYAPVRRQLLCVLRAVNRKRASAGFEPLPSSVLRLKRRINKPFHQFAESLHSDSSR
jgi:hypothetical protein